MKGKNFRLVSEKAACQILHSTPEKLEQLCSKGKLTKFKTSSSLYQYSFEQLLEYRKTILTAARSEGGAEKIVTPEKKIPVTKASIETLRFSPQKMEEYQKIVQDLIIEKKLEKEYKSGAYRHLSPSTYCYFIQTPLYCKSGTADHYSLYKSTGESIPKEKLDTFSIPALYILNSDWNKAYDELRRGIIAEIRKYLQNDDFEKAKTVTVSLLDFILFEHDEIAIEGLEEIVEVLFLESSRKKEMVLNLVPILEKHISLGLHSARIMTLALKFCIKNNYSLKDSKVLCISALLHDIGKTMLPSHLITANPFKLTSEEDLRSFELHPQVGYMLLKDCGIHDKVITYGALEHHERIDGSGFPYGKQKISFLGEVIGIFNAYDTLRNGQNPAGISHSSMDALKIMKKECEEGKFSKELFQSFVYSLL